MKDPSPELFSVYQFFDEKNYECVRRHVPAEEAITAAHQYSTNPAAKLGITRKVMITDVLDHCVFEWQHGIGVTHPSRKYLKRAASAPFERHDEQDHENEP